MGNTSGIKWNGINDAGTLQSSYEILLRDTKTNNEEKILLPDFFDQAITLGFIVASNWTESSGNLFPTTLANNVGIGTNSPSAKLHVVGGAIGTQNANELNGINYGFLGGIGQILFVGSSATDYNGFEVSDNDNVITGRDLTTGSLLRLVANDGNANFQERVTFLNNGNVGIGTATPTSLLTVEDGDIEIMNKNNGLIVYSQDGTAWRVGVSDLGVVTATAV